MIYVGSTTQSLAKRWGGHKIDSKSKKDENRLIFKTINNDWKNWYIELYELYPCSCKNELEKREGEVIRLIGNLNTIINGRTAKEYYQTYKKHIQEKRKEYYETYKKDIQEKIKEYYEEHKEEIIQYKKEWYNNNKDKIQEKKSIKITCDCGCLITKQHLERHRKTLKHIKLIKEQQTSEINQSPS